VDEDMKKKVAYISKGRLSLEKKEDIIYLCADITPRRNGIIVMRPPQFACNNETTKSVIKR
jgi:hypothetical protein